MTGVVMAPGAKYDEYGRNGSSAATEEHWQWAVEGFQTLGDLASELGFLFAFEIHNCYLHDLPEPARKLVDRIDRPSVGINFDYGNIIWHPSDPGLAEAIQVCAGRLYYVHLKNSYVVTEGGQRISIRSGLADGIINNRDLLRQVKALDFRGPICIEAPRQGDREQFAKEDIAYLRSVMAEV
jgi:sugar phosphate isomerase/epimerase